MSRQFGIVEIKASQAREDQTGASLAAEVMEVERGQFVVEPRVQRSASTLQKGYLVRSGMPFPERRP